MFKVSRIRNIQKNRVSDCDLCKLNCIGRILFERVLLKPDDNSESVGQFLEAPSCAALYYDSCPIDSVQRFSPKQPIFKNNFVKGLNIFAASGFYNWNSARLLCPAASDFIS